MFDLTTPQQNIWNLQKFYEGTSISNNCGAMYFDEKCDHGLLNRAINKVVQLHDGMRLRFCETDGSPAQYIAEHEDTVFPSACFDSHASFEEFAAQFAQEPIPLVGGPMYRFVIFDIGDRSGVLLNASHMITDAWSFGIVPNTIAAWYRVFSSNADQEEKPSSYLRFIESEKAYFRSERYEKDRRYWAEQYPEPPQISSIKPNSAPVSTPRAKRYTTVVPPELSAAIDRFYSNRNISQAVLFEAAIIGYLSRINPDIPAVSIGVPVLNRTGPADKRTIGMCISTTPLTVPVSPDLTAEELCRTVGSCQFRLFRHQRFPYSHILRDLHERYDFSGNLYDVIVSFQNARSETNTRTQWFSNGYCEVGLEFHIDNRDGTDRYTLNVDYQTELFRQEQEVALLVERILSIIQQMISQPSMPLKELSILPQQERRSVIHDFNKTDAPFPSDKCVHEQFSAIANRQPDKTALVFQGQTFTYGQLDGFSNSLARALVHMGIGPGSIVPIVSRRSWHVIAAMLGILKAGGAYMCVDPAYPGERIESMFETARCSVALTNGEAPLPEVTRLDLETFDFQADPLPLENRNHADELCYIIFTSGSTGKPKGVSITHRNVMNYCLDHPLNFHGRILKEGYSIVSVTNTIFDIFVTESLLPLLNGDAIFFADDAQVLSQRKLAELIGSEPIDVLQTTPTKMRSYIMDSRDLNYLRKLKAIALGGESLPADLLAQLRELTDAKIFNVYGPAETTVWSTIREMTDEQITVGTPIANTQVYILDNALEPLPIGVAGELCISGEGVGAGYLNRPDLTGERFIPDPFRPGNTLYRTGDLARWRADGEIEHLGRMDTQVKIRGLRIELGEIESVMSSFGPIGLTAVSDKRDETGRQYLVGYYTSESDVDESDLRRYLSAKLPKYMVPNYFVHLDEMPMTASGKTDRKSLPMPVFSPDAHEYEAPESPREQLLCEILEGLLQREPVGVTDDFFELGGDSLCAIEYVAKAHSQGIEFALQNVFDYPTVRSLCEFLSGTHSRKVIYDPADFVKYQPLLLQNRIDDGFVPVKASLGNVLLTGATGFLGAHVLDQYLQEESGTIYCLVRGGAERLANLLDYYFDGRYTGLLGKRIIAIDGDITDPRLAPDMPENIHTVIHTAATVKHYGPYDYFHRVNVQGTQNVIRFARRVGARLLHISTISVSGNSLVDVFDVVRMDEPQDFTESDLFIDQPLDNVYIHSKFEAERAVLDAALEGLEARIIRVGNLSNRISDFRFQPNYRSNAYLNRVKAALELGALPDYIIPLYAEFSPVDQTAQGIILIGQYAQRQTVFHLNSNQNLYFDRMVQILNDLGIQMEVLDGDRFNDMLQSLAKDVKTSYIYEAFQNDMDENGRLVYDSNIHIRNEFTVWFMKKLGFEWAKIDFDYVRGYVEYFRALGHLKV